MAANSIAARIISRWRSAGARGLINSLLYRGRRLRDRVLIQIKYGLHRATAGRLFPWIGYVPLINAPSLTNLIGMTTREERAFLSWWAATKYRGNGVVVELGPFVGASTAALGSGLLRNPEVARWERPLRVYDKFQCSPLMSAMLLSPENKGLWKGIAGDSCRGVFDKQTACFTDLFDVHEVDILDCKHDGVPIELLFVDAMKTPALADAIVRTFFPCLEPQSSWLIQQDFVHYYTSWIHLVQYELRHQFRFEYHVPNSASAVFRTVGSTTSLKDFRLDMATWPKDRIDRAFAYSLSLISGVMQENIYAAKAMLYMHLGRQDIAQSVVTGFLRSGHEPRLEMRNVVAALATAESDE